MMKKQIDLKILIDNDNYLKEYSVDNNESITPTTDKGYFSFEKAIEKLQKLENAQKELEETGDKKIQKEDLVSSKSFLDGTEKEYLFSILKFAKENPVFIKKYQYEGVEASKVLRFGLNPYKTNLDKKELLIREVGDNLSKTSYNPTIINSVKHNKLEIDLMKQSIQCLKDSSEKTVLVDIFARHVTNEKSENGLIKLTKGVPETHTIVLHKIDENNIFLVDPSNYYFSSHIVNMMKEGLDIKIHVPNQKGYKIYSPISSDDTGPHNKLWRDCIDIAVKLAFGFNKYGLNQENIIEDKTVKQLTNNPKISDSIFYSEIFPVREKQKSDIKKVELLNEILEIKNEEYKKEKINKYNILQSEIKVLQDNYDTEMQNLEKDLVVSLSGSIENSSEI